MIKLEGQRHHFFEKLKKLQEQLDVKVQLVESNDPLFGCNDDGLKEECFDCNERCPNESCNVLKETGLSSMEIVRLRDRQNAALNILQRRYHKRALATIKTAIKPEDVVDAINRFPELFEE